MLEILQVPTDFDEFSVAILAVICIVIVVFFIIWIYVAIWIYHDAEKRGSSGVLWALLVFFFGLIPLIIWFIVRPPIKQPGYPGYGYGYMPPPPTPVYQYCPTCGQPMTLVPQYNRWYCNYCRKYP